MIDVIVCPPSHAFQIAGAGEMPSIKVPPTPVGKRALAAESWPSAQMAPRLALKRWMGPESSVREVDYWLGTFETRQEDQL